MDCHLFYDLCISPTAKISNFGTFSVLSTFIFSLTEMGFFNNKITFSSTSSHMHHRLLRHIFGRSFLKFLIAFRNIHFLVAVSE